MFALSFFGDVNSALLVHYSTVPWGNVMQMES